MTNKHSVSVCVEELCGKTLLLGCWIRLFAKAEKITTGNVLRHDEINYFLESQTNYKCYNLGVRTYKGRRKDATRFLTWQTSGIDK